VIKGDNHIELSGSGPKKETVRGIGPEERNTFPASPFYRRFKDLLLLASEKASFSGMRI